MQRYLLIFGDELFIDNGDEKQWDWYMNNFGNIDDGLIDDLINDFENNVINRID